MTLMLLLGVAYNAAEAATITVNNSDDSETAGDSSCTLREAINNANAVPNTPGGDVPDTTSGDCATGSTDPDTILFLAPYTITIGATQLPEITAPVSIDGGCPTGGCNASIDGRGTYNVILEGAGPTSNTWGLGLGAGSNTGNTGSTIKNLNIRNFSVGIQIASSSRHTVVGNFIGTNESGSSATGNTLGISLTGGTSNVTIGGTAAGLGNLISGNLDTGLKLTSLTVAGGYDWNFEHQILRNFIGTTATGTSDLGNGGMGISVEDHLSRAMTIGGTASGAGNTIAFNAAAGVGIERHPEQGGPDISIRGNAIFENGGLGIDLGQDGVTPNDANDSDIGANNLQNFPQITGLTTIVFGDLNLRYKVDTAPVAATYPLALDFYLADSDSQEGQTYLGTLPYTAGQAQTSVPNLLNLTVTVLDGDGIVMTATDSDGNTSEFSPFIMVGTEDADGDNIHDSNDNCPFIANTTQEDADSDGAGDVCDNCVSVYNPRQQDADGNGIGDLCDTLMLVSASCSLPNAVIAANTDAPYGGCPKGNGADVIYLPTETIDLSGTPDQNTTLGASVLNITSTIAIAGNGAVLNNPGANRRFFYVAPTGDLTLFDLTLQGGSQTGPAGENAYNYVDFGDGGTHPGGSAGSNGFGNGGSGAAVCSSGQDGGFGSGGGGGASGRTSDSGDPCGKTPGGAAGLYGEGGEFGYQENTKGFAGGGGGAAAFGGAIFNNDGALQVHRSTFLDNSVLGGEGGYYYEAGMPFNHGGGGAGLGGAIFNRSGDLLVANSTFSGNSANKAGGAEGRGAAIFVYEGTANLSYNTFNANTVDTNDAVHFYGAAVTQTGNIMTNTAGGKDCGRNGGSVTGTGNLVSQNGGCLSDYYNANPQLGSLALHGGLTQSYLIESSSPAWDAGEADCPSATNRKDQRGFRRPSGSNCDIGSFEIQAVEIAADNCPGVSNFDQADADGDGFGDDCDACDGFDDNLDGDNDNVPDGCDNCPDDSNFDQADSDSDSFGDACDPCPESDDRIDDDGDGVGDACDACPGFDDNLDGDNDNVPDDCDICPGFNDNADGDSDGVPDGCDICPNDNPDC